jgi:hypothetical protein
MTEEIDINNRHYNAGIKGHGTSRHVDTRNRKAIHTTVLYIGRLGNKPEGRHTAHASWLERGDI